MRTYQHERVYIPLFGRGFESSDCSAGLTILTAELYDWGFAKYAIKSSNNWRDHRLGQTGTHHLQLVSRVGTFRGQSPQGLHSGTAFRAPLGSWGMTCPFQLPLDGAFSQDFPRHWIRRTESHCQCHRLRQSQESVLRPRLSLSTGGRDEKGFRYMRVHRRYSGEANASRWPSVGR